MSLIRNILSALFMRKSEFTDIELRILNCVRGKLGDEIVPFWDAQISAINRIQRLPRDVEVDFYRIEKGKPTFNEAIAFSNKQEEALIAKAEVKILNVDIVLNANIWSVNGFLSIIEYSGDASYFFEALGMHPENEILVKCKLHDDLSRHINEKLAE